MKIRIGIDATSIVDGGGLTHLKNLIYHYSNKSQKNQIRLIIYASKKVLAELPNNKILTKRNFTLLNKSIYHRLFFQKFHYDKYIKRECDILFSLTGDYTGNFRPYIGMSQNMLLYEREFWTQIKSIKEKARIYFSYIRQKKCFKNAESIIFLSKYAMDYISIQLKLENKNKIVINHGISNQFISKGNEIKSIENYSFNSPFKLLYVSTVHVYKNQWNVVEAVSRLRFEGYPVNLTLIGDIIYSPSGKLLKKTIKRLDPQNRFIKHILSVPHLKIAEYYQKHDGIIFASSCENMPNILLEGMGAGKPIACSDKNPMKEFLKEGGLYFDATSINSIFKTLKNMLETLKLFNEINLNNLENLKMYDWNKTSSETFSFILKNYKKFKDVR